MSQAEKRARLPLHILAPCVSAEVTVRRASAMYVCALNHLHIKGTVENLAGVSLGQIKVAGKAFDADGKLLGTATFSTKQTTLGPGEKAEINLEFLTVMGAQ